MDKNKQYRLENGELYAWLCLEPEELNQSVPKHFPLSEGRTWSNYSTLTTTPDGFIFIHVGEHDENDNRKVVISDDEFQLWLDYFQGRNFWCYSDASEYMKQFEAEVEL